MSIGDIIRSYRKEHHISQRQFSRLCGMSNSYISMLESGKNPSTNSPITPSLDALKSISDAMGISLNDLISKTDDIDVDISGSDLRMASTMGLVTALSLDDAERSSLIGCILEESIYLSNSELSYIIKYIRLLRSSKPVDDVERISRIVKKYTDDTV